MKTLLDVSAVKFNPLVQAIVAAYVRKGGELPELYVSTTEAAPVRGFLAEKFGLRLISTPQEDLAPILNS